MMIDLLEIIKRKDTAARNGFWLEALALAHQFVETQLSLIVSGRCSPEEADRASKKHVWGLANLAKDKGLITPELWQMVEEFNSTRNKALHGLTTGEITYYDIEEHVSESNNLIHRLQNCYVTVSIGPEMGPEE